MKKLFPIVIIVLIVAAGISGFLFWQNQKKIASISNFEECAAAGYPILDSYPARCLTPDKRSFTQELTEEEKKRTLPPQGFCGDGICQDMACEALGCPNPENSLNCPQDCK